MLRKSTSPLHFDRSGSFGTNDNFTKKKKGGGEIEKKKKFSLETTDSRDYVFTFTRDENINNYDDRYN